jgi:hypothetical protein
MVGGEDGRHTLVGADAPLGDSVLPGQGWDRWIPSNHDMIPPSSMPTLTSSPSYTLVLPVVLVVFDDLELAPPPPLVMRTLLPMWIIAVAATN